MNLTYIESDEIQYATKGSTFEIVQKDIKKTVTLLQNYGSFFTVYVLNMPAFGYNNEKRHPKMSFFGASDGT